MADLALVLAAAVRARTLVADLDRTDTNADRHQVAAGVRHELDIILVTLHEAVQELARDASGNRAGKARRDAPATSRAAANAIVRPGTRRREVLAALAAGPATDLQLQETLGMDSSTERPRRGELVDAGLVVETAITRRHNGRDWRVWQITERGRQALTHTGVHQLAESEQFVDGKLF